MKKKSLITYASLFTLLLSAGCGYRVKSIKATPFLLTPNISAERVEDQLDGTNKDIRICIGKGLEIVAAPGSAAHSSDPGYKLFPSHPSPFFDIFARKQLFSKDYAFIISIKYDQLIKEHQVDEKLVAHFTDDLKLTLDELDKGGEFRQQTRDALHLKLTSDHQNYDVIENIFEHLPLPVSLGLAKYSWRHDKTFTYFDVVPDMDLVLHKGVINKTRDTVISTGVEFLNVSRQQGKLILSPFFVRFTGLLIETDPTGPRYATSSIDYHANFQAGPTTTYDAKYLGLLYQGTFRAANSLAMSYCSCVDVKYQCNSLLIRDVSFNNFLNTNRPAWDRFGNLAVPGRILDHDHAVQYSSQQNERVVVDPYLFVFVKKDYIRQLLELGATFENWQKQFPPKIKHLNKLYNGHYLRVRGDCTNVLINVHDKIN